MPEIDRSVAILGTGSAVPKHCVTNAELLERINGYDETSGDFAVWVDRVTHIQKRYFTDPAEDGVKVLSTEAARGAIESSGVDPGTIDQVILCSFTFHDMYPGVHAWLAQEFGITGASFVLTAACSGSLLGVTLGRSLVQSGQCRNVLVIGCECMSRVVDWSDPITAILFADAAGAVVIGKKDDGEDTGFIGNSVQYTDYADGNIQMDNANIPLDMVLGPEQSRTTHREFVRMEGGPRVMRNAVNRMASSVVEVFGYTLKDLKAGNEDLREILAQVHLIPHQANGRIVDSLQKALGLESDHVYRTVYEHGNSSAATNMLTLDYAVRQGNMHRIPPEDGSGKMGTIVKTNDTLKKGDLVVLTAIGAGYIYGAIAFKHAF